MDRGEHLVLDERHTVRQHKVFALFVVVGLLLAAVVWYVQVRIAVGRGAVQEVQQTIDGIKETWK